MGVFAILFGGILAPLNFALGVTTLSGGFDKYEKSEFYVTG